MAKNCISFKAFVSWSYVLFHVVFYSGDNNEKGIERAFIWNDKIHNFLIRVFTNYGNIDFDVDMKNSLIQ